MPLFSSAATHAAVLIRLIPGALKGRSPGKVLSGPTFVRNEARLTQPDAPRFTRNPALSGRGGGVVQVGKQLQRLGNLHRQSAPVLQRMARAARPSTEALEQHPTSRRFMAHLEAHACANTLAALQPTKGIDSALIETVNPAIFASAVVAETCASDDPAAWESDVDSDFESDVEDDFGSSSASHINPVTPEQGSRLEETVEQRFEREGREVRAAEEEWERHDRSLAQRPSVPPKSAKVAQYLAQKAARTLFAQPIAVDAPPVRPSTTVDLLNVITRRIEELEQKWGPDAFDSGVDMSNSDSDWDASDA